MALGIPIITERLILRDFKKSDLGLIRSYTSPPLGVPYRIFAPGTTEFTTAYVRRAISSQRERPRRVFYLAIVRKTDNQLMGTVGIGKHTAEDTSAELGFALETGFWGQGYATEAARALLAFGFTRMNIRSVFCRCIARNTASVRVIEKIGMRFDVRIPRLMWRPNEVHDAVFYTMTEDEWKAAQE